MNTITKEHKGYREGGTTDDAPSTNNLHKSKGEMKMKNNEDNIKINKTFKKTESNGR
jgi:hypothetical protein